MLHQHRHPAARHSAVLGAGTMATPVAAVLARQGPVRCTTTSAVSAGRAAEQPGVTAVSLHECGDANRRAVHGAEIVVLGVKPQQVLPVLREMLDKIAADAVVVSMAAGVRVATLEAELPAGVAVVRAVPCPTHRA